MNELFRYSVGTKDVNQIGSFLLALFFVFRVALLHVRTAVVVSNSDVTLPVDRNVFYS